MLKALYYPHTEIASEVVLKNALLLWDEIETIVPENGWQPNGSGKSALELRAIDLVVRRRVPTIPEQEASHKAISALADRGVLQAIAQKTNQRRWSQFAIHPEKFLDRTWNLLQQHELARWLRNLYDWGVPAEIGLLMMSHLADACAGTRVQKITDRGMAYEWLSSNYADVLGSSLVKGLDASQVAPNYDRLASLSLKMVDARMVPLKRLVEMREREERSGGQDYKSMRRRFAGAIQEHLKRIGSDVVSKNDIRELEHQFVEEIRQDLADLKSELGLAARTALFSSEVGVAALISGGSFAAACFGAPEATPVSASGIIPLIGAWSKYKGARREALKKHVSSWLYVVKEPKLPLL